MFLLGLSDIVLIVVNVFLVGSFLPALKTDRHRSQMALAFASLDCLLTCC